MNSGERAEDSPESMSNQPNVKHDEQMMGVPKHFKVRPPMQKQNKTQLRLKRGCSMSGSFDFLIFGEIFIFYCLLR